MDDAELKREAEAYFAAEHAREKGEFAALKQLTALEEKRVWLAMKRANLEVKRIQLRIAIAYAVTAFVLSALVVLMVLEVLHG